MRVLIIEDEPAYVEALSIALQAEGMETVAATDGRSGIVAFESGQVDFVILDLMLPAVAGLDVLRAIRSASTTPVIVVSAKDSESDVVTALELGADDYLTKPYSARELIARIRAASRRSGDDTPEASRAGLLTFGICTLDVDRYEMTVGEHVVAMPRKEFEVMYLLMERAGRIVTRDRLLDDVWGMNWGDTKSLDQHIRRIRRKLEVNDEAPRIVTIRGVGYRLEL